MIENLPLEERRLDSSIKITKRFQNEENIEKKALFTFDPNIVSFEQLLLLGFREKTAKTFIKFRGKGFRFKDKEDLKKVYGVSESLYARLEPYILIPEKEVKKDTVVRRAVVKQTKIVELNSADSLGLIEINGIGPAFSKRIIKYRSLLGGFVNKEQLKEVYGLTEELYATIAAQVWANAELTVKIRINKDDFKTINRHPYISYELTKRIFNERQKVLLTEQSLRTLIDDENLSARVLPYVVFE